MNYLAHIYLSGNNTLIQIGNFMADSIKGKKYTTYPKEIQIGILLHRQIDFFTDTHKTVKTSKKKLQKKYGLYSGIIVDILYDHFLAKNWSNYSNTPLDVYTTKFYNNLNKHYELLPSRIKNMMPYLITDNWLLSYQTTNGIAKVLNGMNKRTKNRAKMNEAIIELNLFYAEFEVEFTLFFKELIVFAENKLEEISLQFENIS
ncbi:DUF479 domain-containing protein [Seonamhaeicola algicola]|uniref:DUF479 domain-containing protein n=1 Tax=Seonamhaeicola algicola TaxID=1719036 RepID=A0A5C7B9I1_9FLAO|nr:acyl carrier protein phosphodiesterase [Seonamhaeicola algicola]TXE15215.1 DUF479 domain-containing protein [Seonamhaeicola algicola]